MLISVVVTIVDGGATLTRCLEALSIQQHAPPLEVLVPYDDSVAAIDAVARRFPAFRFVSLGALATRHPAASYLGQHELFDRRRAAGLNAATGNLVAILEDRSVPRPDWAATALSLHRDLPAAAIGGAIENGRDAVLNWAVYFCDFGRYQRPFAAGPRDAVSDVNVCYKRHALEAVKSSWSDRYHEPVVHAALRRKGETLYLSPDLIVEQIRDDLGLSALWRERIAWGRLYGEIRPDAAGSVSRFARAAAALLLPGVLFVRMLRDRFARRTAVMPWLAASPAIFLLLTAWSLGEARGYLTRPLNRGGPPRPT